MNKIEQLLEELVSEVLGKFNLEKFRTIAATNKRPEDSTPKIWNLSDEEKFSHPEIKYAAQTLPVLGKGSSRITFAYSGGKALKIATSSAGLAQNKTEVDNWRIAQKQGFSDLVTTIYAVDSNNKWLIAEIVKELKSDQDIFSAFGITILIFAIVLKRLKHRSTVDAALKQTVHDIENLVKAKEKDIKWFIDIQSNEELLEKSEKELAELKENLIMVKKIHGNPKLINFLTNLVNFQKATETPWGDLQNTEHYGRNVQGQIKLLDYGLTREILQKHYE